MKICTRCNGEKHFTDFGIDKRGRDGLVSKCKACMNADSAIWRAANTEKVCEYGSVWREANTEKITARNVAYHAANRERLCSKNRTYREANLGKFAAHSNKRRARKLNATPAWANTFFIEEAYDLAQLRTKSTGFAWHVDHIVPLQGRKVCGLHVESNLQVIPWFQNISKGNKHA